jgi:hypothetical protein
MKDQKVGNARTFRAYAKSQMEKSIVETLAVTPGAKT